MAADHLAVGAAQRREARQIFILVDDVPGQPCDMLRPPACFGQHRHDVGQCLPRLSHELVRFERAVCVPSHLPGDKDDPPCRGDAVRVAARLCPRRWLENLHAVLRWSFRLRFVSHCFCPALARSCWRRRKRWSLPVSVRGRLAVNSIARGYLYGAIARLTNSWSSRARAVSPS